MSRNDLHPLALDYLEQLRGTAQRLPRPERRELCAEIAAHLAEATSPQSPDEDVLNVLERLGEPAAIVEAQQGRQPPSARSGTSHETWAIILLLFGGFAAGIGWLVGVALLWSSRSWTTSDKWLGTLVLPGGFALVPVVLALSSSTQSCLVVGGITRCTGGGSSTSVALQAVLLALVLIAPIASGIHLARRLRHPSDRIQPAAIAADA